MDDWAYVSDLPLAVSLAGRGDMFFELTNDMNKMERQMDIELAFYHPARFVGMNDAHEAEYRRHDEENRLDWTLDGLWADEAELNDEHANRGRAEAMTVLRKTARFGIHGNAALRMHEVSEIKELMHDLSRETDDLLMGPPGVTGPTGPVGAPGDPIQYLMFVQVGA